MKKTFKVPIFEATVMVVVAETHKQAKDAIDKFVGGHYELEASEDCEAFLQHKNSRFALFFERPTVKKKDVVAHEVFHLTHRILEYREMNFDSNHHEMAAMLNGWLTLQVNRILCS
jgi:hypothetical protein